MSNPAFNESSYKNIENTQWEVMTLGGTINKSIALVGLTIMSAIWVWNYAEMFFPYYYPLIFLGLGLALVIVFKKETAPYLAPLYAIVEWVLIGTLSALYEAQLPWIVMQAVSLTFIIAGLMLFCFKTGVIVVTEKFRSIVISATGAIMILYLISIIWSLTGWFQVPFIHSTGPIGIATSVFITGIAAFNLLLDFDMMEKGVKMKAPKYMEWYASFWLLVTLVWLYLEVLRLLGKVRSR